MTSEGPAREFRGEQEVHYRSTRTLDRHRDTTRLRSRLGDTPGIAVSPPPKASASSFRKPAHPDRDIVITGHTALHGTESGRRRLSSRRAAAVAKYLFPQGRPGPGRLFIKKLHIASDPHLADFNALVCDFRAVGEVIE